jgi:hypothetical protein
MTNHHTFRKKAFVLLKAGLIAPRILVVFQHVFVFHHKPEKPAYQPEYSFSWRGQRYNNADYYSHQPDPGKQSAGHNPAN